MNNIHIEWMKWFRQASNDYNNGNTSLAVTKLRLLLKVLDKEEETGDINHDMNVTTGKGQVQQLLSRLESELNESLLESEILDIKRRAGLL